METKAAWIGAGGAIVVALIAVFTPAILRSCERQEMVVIERHICVVKPIGADARYGACVPSRNDTQLDAGKETVLRLPVDPGSIPQTARVDPNVKVEGQGNFRLFKKVEARYESGVVVARIEPNETGGYSDPLRFIVYFTR